MEKMNRSQRRAEFAQALNKGNEKAEAVLQAAATAGMINLLRRRAFWAGFGDGFVLGLVGACAVGALLAQFGVL